MQTNKVSFDILFKHGSGLSSFKSKAESKQTARCIIFLFSETCTLLNLSSRIIETTVNSLVVGFLFNHKKVSSRNSPAKILRELLTLNCEHITARDPTM